MRSAREQGGQLVQRYICIHCLDNESAAVGQEMKKERLTRINHYILPSCHLFLPRSRSSRYSRSDKDLLACLLLASLVFTPLLPSRALPVAVRAAGGLCRASNSGLSYSQPNNKTHA